MAGVRIEATPKRAAQSNESGRFERLKAEAFDDGWADGANDDAPSPVRTSLMVDTARDIISRNTSPDVPFNRSINPYRGCEHGCIYCFARPTHAYLGLSPGLDFETRLAYKPDAPGLLDRTLRRRGYAPETLALGANTDPYQPVERELRLTRQILTVLADFGHPVVIVTKSALVARDIDILAPMAAKGLAMVALSITTLDRRLARAMEPRAPTPPKRLETVEILAKAGIPVSVLASPMIPGLNDHELESILGAARDAGASMANTILLRLPLEIADLFTEWLQAVAPDRADRVLSLVRQCRGGDLYKSAFGTRMRGDGPYADLLNRRFKLALARYRLNHRSWALRTDRFRVPPAPGDQLALF